MSHSQQIVGGLVLSLACFSGLASAQDQRSFRAEDVERMRTWSVSNATGPSPRDCLETLNENLRLLFNDRSMRLSSTVDGSMAALQGQGRARATVQFDFFDENGRPTAGVTQPQTLRESLWDYLVAYAGEERGQFGFGLSPLDGNHSVLLFLDNRGASPVVYWSDQWSTKGGWKPYNSQSELDGEIERLTSSWWASKLSSLGVKFRSRCRLYPLIPAVVPTANMATMNRVPRLRMRSGPGTDNAQVRDADGNARYFHRGETFEVVERQGQWAKLRLEDGTEAWGHTGYMRLYHDPTPALAGVPTETGGATTAIADSMED